MGVAKRLHPISLGGQVGARWAISWYRQSPPDPDLNSVKSKMRGGRGGAGTTFERQCRGFGGGEGGVRRRSR